MPQGVLILPRRYLAGLAGPADYIRAVEGAFLSLAAGEIESLPVGHVPGYGGGFHIKAAISGHGSRWTAIKINGNFPGNPVLHGLPTIQGVLVLADASDGRLLALMDSGEITAQRTAAASAVAARYLARRDATTIAFVGCGLQARHHLAALMALDGFSFTSARCFDLEARHAEALRVAAEAAGLGATVVNSVADASHGAHVIVTCTTANAPILGVDDVDAGTFIAAVGADSEGKSEIAPALMAKARVVADIAEQSRTMGDLRVAVAAGAMRADALHAELAQIVAQERPGRSSDDEIFVFDSTGTAIEDLAAASMLYQRAWLDPGAIRIDLNAIAPE